MTATSRAFPARLVRGLKRRVRRALNLSGTWPYWLRSLLGAVMPPYRASRMRSLYLVTYGRSGSTLVTGYLSKLPGVLLRGENYLFPLPLAEAEHWLRKAGNLSYGGRDEPASPWFGSHLFSAKRWRRDMSRALINQLYPRQPIPRTIGFKEIRWYYRVKPDAFAATMDWLIGLRPPGAVIFLTRDLERVMAGAWWATWDEEKRAKARASLERFERQAQEYARANPEHSVLITYEDFVSSPDAARSMCTLLGLPFRESVWRSTLGERYSYPSAPAATTDHEIEQDEQHSFADLSETRD